MKELSKFKILAYLDRLDELVKTRDTKPITIEIDPMNACNHRCRWCADNKFLRNGDMLTEADISEFCGQLYDFGAKSVLWKGGGEPTLHPGLPYMIGIASVHRFKQAMLTNGSRLDDKLVKEIVNKLDYVRISLDATNEKDYNEWHNPIGPGWDNVIDGIRRLVKEKKEQKSNIKIGVNILYDNRTFRNIYKAIELAEVLGIDVLSFRRAFTETYGFENPWSKDDLYQHELTMKRYKLDYWKKLYPFHVMWDASRGEEITQKSEENLPYCLATPLISIICADAKVYPCCDLRWMEDYCYGDLRKNTFEEIWKSDRRKKVLEELIITKKCFKWCTHRFAYYNEMLNYLIDPDKPHVEIV